MHVYADGAFDIMDRRLGHHFLLSKLARAPLLPTVTEGDEQQSGSASYHVLSGPQPCVITEETGPVNTVNSARPWWWDQDAVILKPDQGSTDSARKRGRRKQSKASGSGWSKANFDHDAGLGSDTTSDSNFKLGWGNHA